MKKASILKQALFNTKKENYLAYLIIIIPLFNFLTGINIDLISPSLPAMGQYFHVNMHVIEETIAISMIGFSLGCVFFGTVIDSLGRRKMILFGLLSYTIASLLAPFTHHVAELMLIRALQGFMVASVSIGSRAVVSDLFTGKSFTIAITYTSVAYSLGPVLAPFLGSLIQHYFNWQANFIAYGLMAGLLFLLYLLFVHESIAHYKPLKMALIIKNYKSVLKHLAFVVGVIIMAMTTIEMLLYPTVGPFLIHNIYHKSVLVYGDTALMVSVGYFFGSLVNRFLIKYFTKMQLLSIGLLLMFLGIGMGIIFNTFLTPHLISLVLPLSCMYFGIGFIFANSLAICMSYFRDNIGPASAIQTTSLTAIGGLGIGVAGTLHITYIVDLFYILMALFLLQFILFIGYFRKHLT